ncbi:conserved Plasmodium protein, unknown function [Babesia microti strain RI]|uniref:VHS domain-containing protein n=1 Tax=Babesia microti (strain RI) TaxID=1133968 RepID=A0A1N6LWE2_BABMR|nr:conserved Plasmodium protein, unknown function [Babesia microti strain RI]SIO73190.1 conserved Plasmodium protein, unknown function [Babesia microti strain RI]|eukprot:XP_021337298.1 conserved Plasmodium protein, unknown function [Babesia microti strain RI]
MENYFSKQINHERFEKNNQIRRRNIHSDQQNFENDINNISSHHGSKLVGHVTDIHGHNAQIHECTMDNNMIHTGTPYMSNSLSPKSGLFLPNLSNLKISRLKKAGKVCVKTIRRKLNSIVQVYDSQNLMHNGITAKEASDAMALGPIKSHREFAMLTENLLAWGGGTYITQFVSIKNFAELTPLSFFENQIINQHIAIRLVDYMCDLPVCKKFTVKYINWKLRFSKIPEEYILSVEYLGFCIKNLGAGFPTFITRSLMRSLGKLLKITTFKYSLARDMKKQFAKIISGSSGHQGVATDPRIHALKSKILFTIQLCHDAFLMQQALYPDFFLEYRRMRMKGIKFPRIPPGSRYMIKDVELITSSRELKLPIDMNVLADISNIVSRFSNGEDDENLKSMLTLSKGKILESINILSDMSIQEFNEIQFIKDGNLQYEDFMDKLFKLNDSIDELLSSPKVLQDLLQFDSNEEDEEEEKMNKELAEIFSMPYNVFEPVSVESVSANEYSCPTLPNDNAWSTTRNGDDDFGSKQTELSSYYQHTSSTLTNNLTYHQQHDSSNEQATYLNTVASNGSGKSNGEDEGDDNGNESGYESNNENDYSNAEEPKYASNKLNLDEIMKTLDQIQSEL